MNTGMPLPDGALSPDRVLALQRTLGNAAVARLLAGDEEAESTPQRSGPVDGAETTDGLRVSDPGDRFEQEAEATATRAMSTSPGHDGPTVPTVPVTSEQAGFACPIPVARLMTEQAFITATADRGPRWASDVAGIDAAVQTYHQFTRAQYQQRANALSTIIGQCRNYLESSRNERRKAGVRILLSQALAEVEAYRAMADSETQQNQVDQFRSMAHALDITLLHEMTEPETAADLRLLDIPSKLQRLAASIFQSSPSEFSRLAQDHVSILQRLLTKPGLPTETAEVLTEVLSHADLISFEGGAPQGTTLTNRSREGAPPQKYTFRAAMGHGGGSAERAGYFAHEMTHVAAHEAFDNTPLMLLFRPDIQDEELNRLVQQRASTVDELREEFEASKAAFTPTQQGLIESKLTYGSSPTRVQSYIASFTAAGKIDKDTVDRINRWVSSAGDRTGLMVEYDTVLNQMLVYMEMWGIDRSNAFYVRLREAAQVALNYRNAARAATAAAGSSSQAPAPSAP